MITQVERLTENLLPDLLDSTAHVLVDARSEFVCQREEGRGRRRGGDWRRRGSSHDHLTWRPPQELSMVLKICARGDSRILPQGDHGRDT